MTNLKETIILITGASSGIGKACFEYLTSLGFMVYGTSRRANGQESQILNMDVTDTDSISNTVHTLIDKHGRIDVLINNAGISVVGAAEETNEQDARQQIETNFWGVVHVINSVLPHMRRQKRGHMINISSLAGLFAIPYQAFYSASKHALEGYTEALRMEVRQFGIRVSLIEPGDFRTEISKNRRFSGLAAKGNGEYYSHFEKAKAIIIKGEHDGAEVDRIARLVAQIIKNPKPRLRYSVGKPLDLLAAKIKKLIPQRVFEWLIRDHYKIN